MYIDVQEDKTIKGEVHNLRLYNHAHILY